MNYLIYKDKGDMKAYANANPDEFTTFLATVAATDIIHFNGKTYTDNVTGDEAEVAKLFIATMTKQWEGRRVIMAPQLPQSTPAPIEQPVAAAKPKKPRKKKEKTNE